ncbi:hypothetical protein BGW36DRAFT_388710 [Talaromyces proteolyticus]|uniref:Uncharacterized protein n=1 Tax=Talaromyces proteolyticus TaxID=1131652 RepID=A0AAD4PSM5_9EURO|nr:uncharacterized protein BGW36DRAFT_388710 [Talaromyces proteolyticus]KAH8691641.1 hypothetical protein BGW36DRAFT_388710 [Talaromyces proteolyticus]
MMVYKALFVLDKPIEIRRCAARVWCAVYRQWWPVDFEDPRKTILQHQSHRDCQAKIVTLLSTDLCTTSDAQLHAAHFPCVKLLDRAGSRLDLSVLRACRQTYTEARHIPYTDNVFVSHDLSSFSNFLYCLKIWQVRSIRHLNFQILEARGMTKFLAEWNDLFSLLATVCDCLRTLSVQVQLFDPPYACWSSFWDAGLLELDRLDLKGLSFVILDRDGKLYFAYTAGNFAPAKISLLGRAKSVLDVDLFETVGTLKPAKGIIHSDLVSFRACRNRFREAHAYDVNNNADGSIFFRFSPNPCPLYVRNLIHLIPRRNRSHVDIRREDRLEREYSTYQYAYQANEQGTDKVDRIIGYQFGGGGYTPDNDEVARNVERVRLARNRLAERMKWSGSATTTTRASIRQKNYETPTYSSPIEAIAGKNTLIDNSPLGSWRRRLNEEVFAPFFECFPPERVTDKTKRGQAWQCHECAISATDIQCFLSQ